MQSRLGDGKWSSTGNGVAKEVICMTHGHELRGQIIGGSRGHQVEVGKGGKLGNYNSITNKTYLKNNEK